METIKIEYATRAKHDTREIMKPQFNESERDGNAHVTRDMMPPSETEYTFFCFEKWKQSILELKREGGRVEKK